ncbi:MAG: chain length determinant protein [Alphaproteobacteria bacterium]|nr:chain length determinant protein [Alphaproteobacteria bacterium]MBU1512948.1 chain length determinant protein [Alphaproteobacteria bacterium]MBU2094878.1 chain length determinant protein [Alphaproteobacteria bacterium]MBU2152784.1 chain length determinant protein [Alphaproteobacteria bacterium]MBU2306307.1 chain length determinant protein [Alphaproteobacteria bacterium]
MIILLMPLVLVVVATVAVFLLPPKYEAKSRVMLDVIKPDPVTGQVLNSPFLRAYIQTQTELIKDDEMAVHVIESLNMTNDPELQREYRERKSGDEVPFIDWASRKVADNVEAGLIEGSNIIQIGYKASSPEQARDVADALAKVYIDTNLQDRREAARRNADWYDTQAQKARAQLLTAESSKSAFERETGLVLQDDKVDIDSARLAALASAAAAPIITAPSSSSTSPAALELAQLDSTIAQASRTLGPNHPDLIAMKRKHDLLTAQVDQERQNVNAAAAATMSASRVTTGMLEAQKAKVMGQRDKVERLRLMQDEIDIRRDQLNKASSRAAELRQEAEVAATAVSLLSNATKPDDPVFPNKPLFIGGALAAGLAGGLGLALLLEIVQRRVRSADDLRSALGLPVLTIISDNRPKKGRRPKLGAARRARVQSEVGSA